jgi:hypothetical protein
MRHLTINWNEYIFNKKQLLLHWLVLNTPLLIVIYLLPSQSQDEAASNNDNGNCSHRMLDSSGFVEI